MFRIATQHPKAGPGHASGLYARFPAQLGVPAALVLLSASPRLLEAHASLLRYYGGHPRLGYELLAAIRLVAGRELDAPDCQDHARRTLLACGLGETEVDALPEAGGSFFDAEVALLAFVRQALASPGSVEDGDLARLRLCGWDDATILDALAHAAAVQAPALLMKALRRNT